MNKIGTKKQFVFICIFSIFVLIVSSAFIISAYTRIILHNAIEHIDGVEKEFQDEFSKNLDAVDQLVNGLVINPTIKDYLTETSTYQKYLVASELVDYFISLSGLQAAIVDISVFRPDGGKISYYSPANAEPDYLDVLQDKPYAYNMGMIRYGTSETKLMLVGSSVFDHKIINSRTNDDPLLGTVVVAVDPSMLSQRLNSFLDTDTIRYMVIDRGGNVVLGNIGDNDLRDRQLMEAIEKAKNDRKPLETKQYRIKSDEIAINGGSILTIIDKGAMFRPVQKSLLSSGGILGCAIILLVVMYIAAARSIIRPIDYLIRFLRGMRHDDIGNLQERIPAVGNRDAVLLYTAFNHMLGEIHELTHRLIANNTLLYQSEIAQKQSEIALLRSQINPHFLYNTLEVIRSISVITRVPEIEQTTKSLAKIMRYSIKGYDNVSLAEEMSIVKDYINIQNARFKDRFVTEFIVDEAAYACVIPKMCLQPVVENAFVHGLELLPGSGRLKITAEKKDDMTLRITVEDNGPGMDEDLLRQINEQLSTNAFMAHSSHVTGIGLVNVNARIRMVQPNGDYGIRIGSRAGEGTKVTITFFLEELKKGV
ncbi:sensor histidine kinase [Paenibacillus sp. MWE-103]|uniref:histidine kinase n=1 Tax=Paenibacillus artemisiicola TaxID=1172618 RepID=A0ABS3WDK7_9BACL|nr:sensor histidine kinase [Paenibacillus artemisiicola]MBO7746352.1 sensor histidine kinase [Paenibacillus artemisiicola]